MRADPLTTARLVTCAACGYHWQSLARSGVTRCGRCRHVAHLPRLSPRPAAGKANSHGGPSGPKAAPPADPEPVPADLGWAVAAVATGVAGPWALWKRTRVDADREGAREIRRRWLVAGLALLMLAVILAVLAGKASGAT